MKHLFLTTLLIIICAKPDVFSLEIENADSALMLKWQLGYNSGIVTGPVKWIPATVPGAVQIDIAKADNYGLWYYAENWKNYLWMEDRHFTYSVASPADRSQANRSVKPAVSYGWDWHPRLVPSGIWDETGLFIEPEISLNEVQLDYSLNDSLNHATLIMSAAGRNLSGCSYIWSLTDKAGKEVLNEKGVFNDDNLSSKARLNHPELWWPHDQGHPSLYTLRFHLSDKKGNAIQDRELTVGFRRVRMVINTGSTDPAGYPKSRILPPFQMEINGRRIFCKGTNWVNPEVFPGIISAARYEELIDWAVEANFNIFRVWGGGIINKESFYELCDQKGILVWQEFPLACNNYPDDPGYLQILEQESGSIIKRLKKHASLVLWCGGNELYNSWGGMNDQSLALRLLNSQCLKYDPTTPFIPTSPIEGVGHGNYVFRNEQTGQEVFEIMKEAHFTAYTEFGIPAPASVEVLKSFIPANELWPPKPGTSWESHHAYNAWGKNTWLMQDLIEDYFGKSASLEELVAHGQLLQGEGYKCIYEEARRQKPYCAMAINWCYNEPWPTAANNSLISYPNIPKPGFYQVRNACRPALASATISKFKWLPGDLFKTRVWMLSDKPEKTKAGKLRATIVSGDKVLILGTWVYQAMEPNTNQEGPEFSVIMPDLKPGTFKLILEIEGSPELNSEYTMIMEDRF